MNKLLLFLSLVVASAVQASEKDRLVDSSSVKVGNILVNGRLENIVTYCDDEGRSKKDFVLIPRLMKTYGAYMVLGGGEENELGHHVCFYTCVNGQKAYPLEFVVNIFGGNAEHLFVAGPGNFGPTLNAMAECCVDGHRKVLQRHAFASIFGNLFSANLKTGLGDVYFTVSPQEAYEMMQTPAEEIDFSLGVSHSLGKEYLRKIVLKNTLIRNGKGQVCVYDVLKSVRRINRPLATSDGDERARKVKSYLLGLGIAEEDLPAEPYNFPYGEDSDEEND